MEIVLLWNFLSMNIHEIIHVNLKLMVIIKLLHLCIFFQRF